MKEIKENNRLIAEFMGYEVQTDPTERHFGRYKTPITKVWIKENELEFDTSWNWLMEVLKEIDNLEIEIPEDSNLYGDITHGLLSFDIEMAYGAVVEFIKWYKS